MKRHIFIFEDNPDMSVSRLLSKHSYNGENLFFSNGNTLLSEKLIEVYNRQDLFYIYYDISPDNKILITRYYALLENIRMLIDGYNGNVYVIPVICTEYYVIKMLKDFFYIDNNLEYAVDRIDYDRIKSDYKQRSIERAYKYMLRQLDKKFHNVNEKESLNLSVEGLFYKRQNSFAPSYRSSIL